MKFSATLLLLASFVAAHGDEPHGNSTAPATCVSNIECKLNELTKSKDAAKKFEACGSKTDEAEMTKCIYSALGLKDKQIENLAKLQKSIASCNPTTEAITSAAPCLEKCTGAKQEECSAKCMQPMVVEYGKCVKKLAGKPDLDLAKSLECSKTKCTQSSLSELFDCDYTCNKELYDALIAKSGGDSTTDKDSKDGKTKEDGKGKDDTTKDGKSGNSTEKDGKSGNSTEKDKGGKSSAMTSYGMNSFGTMAIGTILFALLV
ncbi:hypothetical protein CONCODRAFT_86352 [Conidiobolus coronatus NRRL 28638]|uniref:Extracellular membrane protein CFEM domain-containing protein n=1 Tax=Conidiobolus coronatus (strain ATCC 28846 / CBS 209.66 / NRRL 28638) TaxID=796925 RepID=A0A137P0X6_CONC2|nr:hypothetical protein CONCODRAFT_86352 [Conidiobolus coronatus NRRL 28638]|eukprot:KXN68716.1 hypothetical protein CONCODRAFT_86352 [Conidiobolus coronatus NRRL 28638]